MAARSTVRVSERCASDDIGYRDRLSAAMDMHDNARETGPVRLHIVMTTGDDRRLKTPGTGFWHIPFRHS